MILRELLLEDEHVVHIGENAMEVGREQVRLDFLAHLRVALPVQMLNLTLSDLRELTLVSWLAVVQVLHMLHLKKQRHVRVKSPFL